jgi:sporulation protein YlmC with PRC-barrel domain
MAQNTNLNVSPYYDDYDPNKNFYKVLFRPGYSVQSRELTTLQSILQDQIEKYGNYQFKQGQLVIPGEVGLNTQLNYVKISSVSEVPINEDGEIVFKKYDIAQLVGEKLVGITSGVQAIVLKTQYETEESSDTIFVSYISSGDSNLEATFRQGENLEVVDGVNTPILTVGTDGAVLPNFVEIENIDTGEVRTQVSPALGFSSGVSIQEGVYFVNGFFVTNREQLVILDAYNNRASGRIAFDIEESIVTPEEDSSLFDNSRGSSNFSAPGAHRLKIDLIAKKYGYRQTLGQNSILLLSIKNGSVEKKVTRDEYSLIETTLARRTYDESGDYVVSNFDFDVREYYQKDNNGGVFAKSNNTGLVNGLTESEANSKLLGTVGTGKAYVKGFEVINKETKYITLDKATDTITRNDVRLTFSGLSSFYVTNVHGTIPVNAEGVELSSYPSVFLFDVFNNNRGKLIHEGDIIDGVELDLDPSDIGVKTILIERSPLGTVNGDTLGSPDPLYLPPNGSYIWIIQLVQTEEGTGNPRTALVNYARILNSKLTRSQIIAGNTVSTKLFVEMDIVGRRDIIDAYYKDYDLSDPNGRRRVFLSQSSAFDINDIDPETGFVPANYYWGSIVDYTSTKSPLIGICKPSDFAFVETGAGFNPISGKVASKGKENNVEVYNGIFNYKYFNATYFTKITLQNLITAGFEPGSYVTGSTSGAYGVVEGIRGGYYSSTDTLHLKVQQGTFVEGETLIDEKNNTVKIAKNNTISHFVVHSGGDDYSSGSQITLDGITYDRSKISVNTITESVVTIDFVDESVKETTYENPPTISISTGNGAIVSAVLHKDVITKYNSSQVKSLYARYGSGSQGENIFTANIESDNSRYAIFKNVTDSTFSGKEGFNYITVNALSKDLNKFLKKGDIIQFVDDEGKVIKTSVRYATSTFTNKQARIYLNRTLDVSVTNSIVTKISTFVENPSSSLLVPTGSKDVESLVKDITDSKISYFFRRDFVSEGTSAAGDITFAAQLPFGTQRFAAFNQKNYLITVLDPGQGQTVSFAKGDIVYLKSEYINIVQSSDSNTGLVAGSVTVTFPSEFFGSNLTTYPKIKLTATLEVSKAKPKLKTSVENKRILVASALDKVVPIRGQDYDTGDVGVFSYSDVYKLRYVYEGTVTSPPSVDASGILVEGNDVTDYFVFDDGQRDTFYDVSRLILKPGFPSPTGQLVIGFDYFKHSQGQFCTVDSYNHESGVDIADIPTYNSKDGRISLGDVIDFRPKVDTTQTTSGYQNGSILSSGNYTSFIGDGGAPSVTPASGGIEYTFKFDESSYLDRIDALFLSKDGSFVLKKGNSSKNPSRPDSLEDAIPLYYIYLPSLTKSSKDVKLVPVDNKRFTMKDIAKLEKRIERLEYYTSLSILEQQALNMQIKDDFGFDRFKSGFLVDNFESHGVGDISSSEYVCSIDPQQSVLKPEAYEDNINLIEANTREDERFFDGYVVNNNIVTLPFTSTTLLGNSSATSLINPNPFVVLQYVGDIKVSPTVDQWFDLDTIPLVTNTNTNIFNVFIAKGDNPREAFASISNSFLINWVGVNQSFLSINPLSQQNTNSSLSKSQDSYISSSSNVNPNNNEIGKGLAANTIGDASISSSLQLFARSIPIKFTVTRMKPKTVIYPFIDGRDVSRWVCPDSKFSGIPTSSLTAFGTEIVTDEYGNASGLILLPSGYPPVQGTSWNGNIFDVQYDTGGEIIKFTSGQKSIRFTTSKTNESKNNVESYSEVIFYSKGSKVQNPSDIISTQPSYFKANEGVQFIASNTDNPLKPNPLAQTFRIENFDGGVFVTSVDLFFNKKSQEIPIKAYISDMSIGKPGKNIVPGTEVVMLPKTFLKVTVSGNITIEKNDVISGVSSGCSGPIEKILDSNGNEIALINDVNYNLNNEQIYTFVLSNHNGKEFIPDENLSSAKIAEYNNVRNSNISVKITKNYGKIKKFVIDNVGSNYQGAVVTVESPQLPGESLAVASLSVSEGIIYNAEVAIPGSGYTSPPSVIIKGIGNGATGASIRAILEIDTFAVRMGIAVDDGTNSDSTTLTKFKFDYPVYLKNDTDYALQIETDSTEYALWTSRLGELEKISGVKVSSQPLLGSLYKSQNTDTWVEDIFEDVKFTLNRAKFDTAIDSEITLVNDDTAYQKLITNPLQTSATSNASATSKLFKNNNSIIKVTQRDHGFESSGKSRTFFKFVDNFSGISGTQFTKELYKVSSVGLDTFTVISASRAAESKKAGGARVFAPKNIKYEKLYADIYNLQLPKTKIDSTIKTVNVVPIDSTSAVYTSYSVSDYQTTFLNEEQYFENQKFVTSKINELLNDTGKSLSYKLKLSSQVDYLTPVVDLNNCTVKTYSTRVENGSGKEDRYGKRYEVLEFWPVYTMSIVGAGAISNNQSIVGVNSGAEGRIIQVNGSTLTVRMLNNGIFESGEPLTWGVDVAYNVPSVYISIESPTSRLVPSFDIGDKVIAYSIDAGIEYETIIDGTVVVWDSISGLLTLQVEKQPINDNFVSASEPNTEYGRASSLSEQQKDIFRVNDYISYGIPGQIRVKSIDFTNGVDYKGDIEITDTSSAAKYLTKEVSLNVPATSLDVRLTANSRSASDIIVMYRILDSDAQESLSSIKWEYLDLDLSTARFSKKDSVSGVLETREDYQELKYYTNDLPEYTRYQVKVILKTDTPVFAPKLQDIRIVASS